MKKGFTLIELLVVVLIIGILSAVALPQYKKAVEKSKALQAITLLKSLSTAKTAYYMANGVYPTHFNELSLEIPFTGDIQGYVNPHNTDVLSNKDWSVQIYLDESGTVPEFSFSITRLIGKYKGAGFQVVDVSGNIPNRISGKIECVERHSGTYAYVGPAGEYCHDLFKGELLLQGTTTRIYSLP